MKRKTIFINGMFYRETMTGIERFAYEITKRLDDISKPNEFAIVIPADFKNEVRGYKNIKVIYSPKTPGKKQFNNVKLHLRLLLNNGVCLDYGNSLPKFCRAAVFLHDIYCKTHQDDFSSERDKKIMGMACRMYGRIAKKAKAICTVSEFSKAQIMQHYNVPAEKIHVIYDGADYIKDVPPDFSIFGRLRVSPNEQFYFTLGSLSKRKNLKWIMEHAEIFPGEKFVVAGAALLNVVPPELEKLRSLPNVVLAGRLTDGEIKALMQKCRAFVFPSYFEGFGLPPLEALMCGAQVIVARAASLPEIYADCVHYIQPDNPNVNLDKLLSEKVSPPQKLFEKYSLDAQAKKLYVLLVSMNDQHASMKKARSVL